MKKLIFALACVVGLMTFASCDQTVVDEMMKQLPELEFVQGDGYFTGNTNVYIGTELKFQVKVAPNAGSEAELVHFDLSITDLNGQTQSYNPEIENPSGENTFVWSFTPTEASTYTVTATVNDNNSNGPKTNIKAFVINVVKPVEAVNGTFKGEVNISGHLKSNEIAGYEAYDQDYELKDVPVGIMLGTVSGNEVSATFDIEGYPVTLYGQLNGTMEDGTITFNDLHFNKTINLFVDVTVDLTMNVTGTIKDGVITLNGTAEGNGSTTVAFVLFTVDMTNCVITGTLNKVEE